MDINKLNIIIDDKKVLEYLLSLSHPIGHSKAVFFRANGYNEDNIDIFKRDLIEILKKQDSLYSEENIHGIKLGI